MLVFEVLDGCQLNIFKFKRQRLKFKMERKSKRKLHNRKEKYRRTNHVRERANKDALLICGLI